MADTYSLAESILEQMADAVIYADEKGTIRRWNRAAAALFGYSAAEAVGRNLDLIVPEHLRAAHWRGFEAAMTNGVMKLEGRPTVTRAVHQSGRKIYVEMTFALVKDQGGATRGAVALARDATERIEQQRAGARRESSEDRS
jgi:PAS domain S-box-containing protein